MPRTAPHNTAPARRKALITRALNLGALALTGNPPAPVAAALHAALAALQNASTGRGTWHAAHAAHAALVAANVNPRQPAWRVSVPWPLCWPTYNAAQAIWRAIP